MKRIKLCFIMVFALCTMLFMTTSAFALKGDGAENNPFIVTNQAELCLLNDFPDCSFELGCDIEMSGKWETIVEKFTGSLDGKGYTIRNLPNKFMHDNYGIIKNVSVVTAEKGISDDCIFVGTNRGTISDCSFSGILNGGYCGGVLYNNYGTIERCTISGIVNGSAYSCAGGIVHENFSDGKIIQCVCKADVSMSGSGSRYIGGISARNSGLIDSCYFYGNLSYTVGYSNSYNNAGGISATNGTIRNCFAVTKMNTSSYIHNYGISTGGTMTNSFYDKTVAGISSTATGTPKSTIAMKMKATYANAGWDFENVWGISPEINDGYPYLLWEYPAEEPKFSVTVADDIVNGTVTLDKSEYTAGDEIIITAKPSNGYEVDEVTVNGAAIKVVGGVYKVTFAGDEDIIVSATFKKIYVPPVEGILYVYTQGENADYVKTLEYDDLFGEPKYIAVENVSNGTIELDKDTYKKGETVTVIATPDDGYKLVKITVNGVEILGNEFVFNGKDDVVVSAEFKQLGASVKIVDTDAYVFNGLGGLRFITTVDNDDSLPIEYYGTWIIPQSIFERDLSLRAELRKDKNLVGSSYTADVVDIPEEFFDKPFVGISFVKFEGVKNIITDIFTISINDIISK